MKKLIFLLILIFIALYCDAQYSSIKTPTNVTVESIDFTEYSPAILAQLEADAAAWIVQNGSDAVRVGPASKTYNCHCFAWHTSDGGNKDWVNQKNQAGSANISKYWSGTSPTYVASTSGDYTKVFLPASDGDHSAITIATPGFFKSKWGAWPLYTHSFTTGNTPYNTTGMQVYKLIMTGSNQACIPNVKTYTTLNIAGSSYTWTSTNFTVSSSTYTASATANSNGSGYVQVSFLSPYSNTTVSGKVLTWVGVPVLSVTGPSEGCTNNTYNFAANPTSTLSNASNYTWDLIPLNGNYLNPFGYLYSSCAITFYNPYSASGYDVRARAQNSCGISGYGIKNIWIHNCYSFSLSPNPAYETVTLTKIISGGTIGNTYETTVEDADIVYTLRIIDYMGILYYSGTFSGNSYTIPISNLKNGSYIVQIINGKEIYNSQLIVKH